MKVLICIYCTLEILISKLSEIHIFDKKEKIIVQSIYFLENLGINFLFIDYINYAIIIFY